MKRKKKQPDLKDIVNMWLKKNQPKLYVDKMGNIGLVKEKGKQSQAFGIIVYGWVLNTGVKLISRTTSRGHWPEVLMVRINAADPEFFEKLAKFLPKK